MRIDSNMCSMAESNPIALGLDDFIEAAGIRIEPVTLDQAHAARSAHLQFGKGTAHGAALNYGDCFAYALAKAMDASLLCKGSDFPLTDIGIA
jgi:ribonuclease VapC